MIFLKPLPIRVIRVIRGLLFLLKHFDRVPSFVGRLLLVLERAFEIHLGQKIVGIKFEKTREQDFGLVKSRERNFKMPSS